MLLRRKGGAAVCNCDSCPPNNPASRAETLSMMFPRSGETVRSSIAMPQRPMLRIAACWTQVILWGCGMSIGWAQGNGVIAVIPNPNFLPPDAVAKLNALFVARQQFFQAQKFQEMNRQSHFFEALKVQWERQKELRLWDTQLRQATRRVNAARNDLVIKKQQAIGFAGRGMGPAVQNAQRVLNAEQAQFNQIQNQANNFNVKQIMPLQNFLAVARPQWDALYLQMGQLVTRDATDPQAGAMATAWGAAGVNDGTFIEADVLGAVASIYAGDLPMAEKCLERASLSIANWQLLELPVAVDCCHGWLLCDKPKMCQEYVKYLKKLPDTATTVGQDWAIGLHAYAECKLHSGAEYFNRAVGGAIALRQNTGQEGPPAMWADAVVSLLQTDEVNATRARNLWAKAGPAVINDGDWQVLRARAMFAAEAADWNSADELLRVCMQRAPRTMHVRLGDQLAASHRQVIWNIRDSNLCPKAGGGAVVAPPAPAPAMIAGGGPLNAPRPNVHDDSDNPRYEYDGRYPKSDFRLSFEEIGSKTDMPALMRWREMVRKLFDSGLSLNDIDWAEHRLENPVSDESLTADETIRFQRYTEFNADRR